jgi:hypothetical protein
MGDDHRERRLVARHPGRLVRARTRAPLPQQDRRSPHGRVVGPLRAAHSGHVGHYVAWLTFGTALVGGLFALTLR